MLVRALAARSVLAMIRPPTHNRQALAERL